MTTIPGILLAVGGILAAGPVEPALRSSSLAKQLSAALSEQRLEAIAAQDPDEPERFVAALFFPGAQLLVVSARYPSPSLLQSRLSNKQYRDVYADLQTSSIANTSWLLQDMKADGLSSERDQTPDVLYVGSVTTIFDGDWKKHDLSEKAYDGQLSGTDKRYSEILEILLAQLRKDRSPAGTTVATTQR